MDDDARPRTVDEILALPIGPAFGIDERLIDGVVRLVLVVPEVVAVFHGEHDVMMCADATGTTWILARYADGRWFRRRGLGSFSGR
jgi:hypothetical protein